MFATACEKVVTGHGYMGDFNQFKTITIGKDTAQDVMDKVGSPTARSSVEGADGSYRLVYSMKLSERSGFLDPKTIEQRTMIVLIDCNDVVRDVYEAKTAKEIELEKERTKTGGKSSGFFEEIFGGVGFPVNKPKSEEIN
jgi:outer membrane protein assembly factor BamE (lipoprotein component of BamABCDE complex)